MLETPSIPKPREGAWLWLFKIAAGLLIIIFLGIHFVINHLVAPEGLLTYADVVRYYNNPIVPPMEIAFLIFVIAHALVGMRSIILDLNPSDRLLRALDVIFLLVGIGFTVYGTWLVWVIAQRGAAL